MSNFISFKTQIYLVNEISGNVEICKQVRNPKARRIVLGVTRKKTSHGYRGNHAHTIFGTVYAGLIILVTEQAASGAALNNPKALVSPLVEADGAVQQVAAINAVKKIQKVFKPMSITPFHQSTVLLQPV